MKNIDSFKDMFQNIKSILGKLLIILPVLCLFISGCENFLEIRPPKDKFEPKQIYENDGTATSAITGIYSRMITSGQGFATGDVGSVTNLSGLTADELNSHSSSLNFFYENEIPTRDFNLADLWSYTYNYIYTANAIIEGLPTAAGISGNTKNQLMGEAKFVRAFCYFYLINLFGDVPLILNTDYRFNDQAPKTIKAEVYEQIVADLVDAENLLAANYVTAERARPNKWAAKALLSRVYLYTEKWSEAASNATEVMDQQALYSLVPDLDQVFLKNSKEAIWQLVPQAGINTNEGTLFILTTTPTNVSITPQLMAAFNDPGDNRASKWIKELSNTTGKYNYPFKYKVKNGSSITAQVTEYSIVIRLAEMYLIRAEARAKMNQPELALEDVNLIRNRAGLAMPLVGLNQEQALVEVEKQRRLELFSEWGHRWLDLKRTDRASAVLGPIKGATWKSTDVLYPIPDIEINRNQNISQNLGY